MLCAQMLIASSETLTCFKTRYKTDMFYHHTSVHGKFC